MKTKEINLCRIDDKPYAEEAKRKNVDVLRMSRLVTTNKRKCNCPWHTTKTFIRPNGTIYATEEHLKESE